MTTMREAMIKAAALAVTKQPAAQAALLTVLTAKKTHEAPAVQAQSREEDWALMCTQQKPLLLTSHELMLPPPPPTQTRFLMQAHDDLPLMLVTDTVTGRWVEVPLHEIEALRDFLDKMFG